MTGEDLGYKPGVVEKVKFEYSPLDEALNKWLKKYDKVNKVIKYDSDLMYDFVHNFNKYTVSNFNKISWIDSKFDVLNRFYKDFKKLEGVKSNQRKKAKKNNCTKNASLSYNGLIDIYEKENNQDFESKDEDWRLKHNYKNLKDLDYQPDQIMIRSINDQIN